MLGQKIREMGTSQKRKNRNNKKKRKIFVDFRWDQYNERPRYLQIIFSILWQIRNVSFLCVPCALFDVCLYINLRAAKVWFMKSLIMIRWSFIHFSINKKFGSKILTLFVSFFIAHFVEITIIQFFSRIYFLLKLNKISKKMLT